MTLFSTIAIAFIFIIIAMVLVSIGLLLTGKSRVKLGMCGRVPKKKDDTCGTDTTCGICKPENDDIHKKES